MDERCLIEATKIQGKDIPGGRCYSQSSPLTNININTNHLNDLMFNFVVPTVSLFPFVCQCLFTFFKIWVIICIILIQSIELLTRYTGRSLFSSNDLE